MGGQVDGWIDGRRVRGWVGRIVGGVEEKVQGGWQTDVSGWMPDPSLLPRPSRAVPAAAGPGGRRFPSGPPHGAASCPPTTAGAGYAPVAAVHSPASACPRHPSAGSGRSGAGCGVC